MSGSRQRQRQTEREREREDRTLDSRQPLRFYATAVGNLFAVSRTCSIICYRPKGGDAYWFGCSWKRGGEKWRPAAGFVAGWRHLWVGGLPKHRDNRLRSQHSNGTGSFVLSCVSDVFLSKHPYLPLFGILRRQPFRLVAYSCRKIWGQGQSCQAIELFQSLRQISFISFIFDTSLSYFMTWNLQSYPTTVLNGRMWHFRGSKHTLTPPTYFYGVKTPNPQDLRAWFRCVRVSARN